MKSILVRLEEGGEQGFRRFVHLLSAVLAGCLIGISVASYALSLANPKVPMGADGATVAEGRVTGMIVELANPSTLDRFMASLPEVPIILSVTLVFAYLLRSDLLGANLAAGMRISKKAHFTLVGTLCIVFISSILAETLRAQYFDITVLSGVSFTPVLATSALGVLFLDSLVAKTSWNKEHKRADDLDKKMQDVV